MSDKTQMYSTWGDKLLQHTDVLYSIQKERKFIPITIQISLTELCDSDCPFCSVADRPLQRKLPFKDIEQILMDFKALGAKSIELTGGGNPLLYKDGTNNINNVIALAHRFGYDIGIITNSHSFKKFLDPKIYDFVNWIRVSLIQLEEGRNPEDYNFNGFPESKLGFSYIIYDPRNNDAGELIPDALSRTNKIYGGTTLAIIDKMKRLVELHPDVKFVRLAGDCLIPGQNYITKQKWEPVIKKIDEYDKFFIKDIGMDDNPYDLGCYVGMIRPYVAPGHDSYNVYICTSHVLNSRTYDERYSLCKIADIIPTWNRLNEHFQKNGFSYEVDSNKGQNWTSTCKFCFYRFNNKLLHTVAKEMPDKNFP